MKHKFDLKNSKKFLDRVKKLEGNQHIRLLNDPVEVDIGVSTGKDVLDTWVVAIGHNNSYLMVDSFKTDDNHAAIYNWILAVHWIADDGRDMTNENYHDKVTNVMLNWLMMHSEESDLKKVKPNDIEPIKVAIQAIAAKKGKEYFASRGPKIMTLIQGALVEVDNPFHK